MAGADVNAMDERGATPLHYEAENNEYYEESIIINFLIASGADVHARDEDDKTPLHKAATYGWEPSKIEALLAADADVHAGHRSRQGDYRGHRGPRRDAGGEPDHTDRDRR